MNAKKVSVISGIAAVAIIGLMIKTNLANARQTQSHKPYEVKEFSIHTPGKLNVQTSGGYITVKGSTGNKVRVEMYVTKNGKALMPSDTKLNHFNINIGQDGNKISAIAKRKAGSGWKFWNRNNISISFVVYTPRKMDADLHTSGGSIEATNLSGNQQIATSGGYLKLDSLKGTVKAETSGGSIHIRKVSGKLNAQTSGGSISAQNSKGELKVHTSGGSINLKDIAGSVDASTSGGSVIATLNDIRHATRLRTSGGNIEVTVPQNAGLKLDLHGNAVHTQLKNFSGTVKRNNVDGTINGGGPLLSARTSGGSVHISYH